MLVFAPVSGIVSNGRAIVMSYAIMHVCIYAHMCACVCVCVCVCVHLVHLEAGAKSMHAHTCLYTEIS